MFAKSLLFASLALTCSASTVFTDPAAWRAASVGASITDETFSNGQLSSGLQIDTCVNAPSFTGCSVYDGGNGYWGGLSNGKFTDSVGQAGYAYRSTLFTLPSESQALGITLSVPASHQGSFSLELLQNGAVVEILYPAGGSDISTGELSSELTGFFGVVSDAEFNSFELKGGDVTYSLTDVSFDPPVPEPAALALTGLGLLGVFYVRRRCSI